MQKKFFFFDIDGTLTDRYTGIIVPSAKEAVRRLKEAGHFVAINTGRAFYKADRFRSENGFDHMVCNGGHGIFFDGELRENRPLDYKAAKAVYDQAIALGYGVLVAVDDTKKVYSTDFKFYDQVGIRREPPRISLTMHLIRMILVQFIKCISTGRGGQADTEGYGGKYAFYAAVSDVPAG